MIKKDELEKAITEYLKQQNEKRDQSYWDVKPDIYHVTDATKCLRRAYYKRKIDKDPDGDSLRNFKLGHITEDILEEVFKNAYHNIGNSERIKAIVEDEEFGEFQLVGETDIVQYDKMPVNDDVMVESKGDIINIWEIKSTKNLYYQKNEPSDYHPEQLNLYLGLLGLGKGHIVYIDKRDLSVAVHELEFDEELFKESVERIKELRRHIKKDEEPDADPKSWECGICSYQDECDYHTEIKKGDEDE